MSVSDAEFEAENNLRTEAEGRWMQLGELVQRFIDEEAYSCRTAEESAAYLCGLKLVQQAMSEMNPPTDTQKTR